MLSWKTFSGCMAAAGLVIGLFATAGCQQLSQQVRKERPAPDAGPALAPDFQLEPTPSYEPSPKLSNPPPSLPALPPPAPPMDASRGSLSIEDWDSEPVEFVDEADDEFFPRQAAAYPPAFVADRAAATAGRYAAEGRAALQRHEAREPIWPVITPGPSSLKPVKQPPALAPVPR